MPPSGERKRIVNLIELRDVTCRPYTRNSLVRLRHQRHHHKPDWPRKCSLQDHETTSCDVWPRKTTSRSHSGPHGTASGCQGKNWSPPRAPDNRPQLKRPRGQPCHPWMQQLEIDTGLAADVAWDTASDRVVWRAQRPIAGQVVQWMNEWMFLFSRVDL